MAERAQLLFDGGTNDAFFRVMKDIGTASRRRLEARVADRSDRLSQMVNLQDSGSPIAAAAREKVMGLIGPICAVIGVVVKIVTTGTEGVFVLAGGLIAGAAFILGYFLVRAKRLLGRRREGKIVIRLDRWVKKNSMATDDLIRRQMGREFSNSLAGNCSELGGSEHLTARGEGVKAPGAPGTEEGSERHLGVGALVRAGAAADLPAGHQVP